MGAVVVLAVGTVVLGFVMWVVLSDRDRWGF